VGSFFWLQLEFFYLVSYVGHNLFQANVSKLTVEDLGFNQFLLTKTKCMVYGRSLCNVAARLFAVCLSFGVSPSPKLVSWG
jgi:hypothetical protein